MIVVEVELTTFPFVPPNQTLFFEAVSLKFVPVIVTNVPTGPDSGEKEMIFGGEGRSGTDLIKERDVSSNLFQDSFKELIDLISKEEGLREELIKTRYFRDYAYTNQFEFLSVIVETFIETPKEFRQRFPGLYSQVKQMLNYNFNGY